MRVSDPAQDAGRQGAAKGDVRVLRESYRSDRQRPVATEVAWCDARWTQCVLLGRRSTLPCGRMAARPRRLNGFE